MRLYTTPGQPETPLLSELRALIPDQISTPLTTGAFGELRATEAAHGLSQAPLVHLDELHEDTNKQIVQLVLDSAESVWISSSDLRQLIWLTGSVSRCQVLPEGLRAGEAQRIWALRVNGARKSQPEECYELKGVAQRALSEESFITALGLAKQTEMQQQNSARGLDQSRDIERTSKLEWPLIITGERLMLQSEEPGEEQKIWAMLMATALIGNIREARDSNVIRQSMRLAAPELRDLEPEALQRANAWGQASWLRLRDAIVHFAQ